MSIDEAKEEFDFFNEGDYITREMATAKEIVLKKLHETESDLYEANKRIADLLLILGDRDRMIDKMAEQLAGIAIWDIKKDEPLILMSKEEVIKYYERESKNAKD